MSLKNAFSSGNASVTTLASTPMGRQSRMSGRSDGLAPMIEMTCG